MRTLSGPAVAAMAATEITVVQLVAMRFPGANIFLNSSNRDFDYGGATYLGAAGLGTISAVDDSPGEVKGLQLEISGVPVENIALALDDSNIVQGTPLEIRLAIISDTGQLLDASLDWAGRIDTMSIVENGETCSIAVTAESTAVDLLRGNPLTTSNADQQYLYPGDRACEYVAPQSGQPVVWPTKQLFIASR